LTTRSPFRPARYPRSHRCSRPKVRSGFGQPLGVAHR
jgi:hypothetical protein